MDTLEPWKGIRTSHRNLKVGYFKQHFVDHIFDLSVCLVEIMMQQLRNVPGLTGDCREEDGGLSADARPVRRYGRPGAAAGGEPLRGRGAEEQGRLRSPLRPQSKLPGARYAQTVLLYQLYCSVLYHSDIETIEALGHGLSE